MRPEPPAELTIAHDQWEISEGVVDAFRARWGMDELADMPDWEKRRITAREYVTDILGIDHDG